MVTLEELKLQSFSIIVVEVKLKYYFIIVKKFSWYPPDKMRGVMVVSPPIGGTGL
jgi:hypothetical protein